MKLSKVLDNKYFCAVESQRYYFLEGSYEFFISIFSDSKIASTNDFLLTRASEMYILSYTKAVALKHYFPLFTF